MAIIQLLQDQNWDAPFFKKLAMNDTGEAAGNQSGMLVPIPLRPFFPRLLGVATAEHPTIDSHVRAELFANGVEVDRVVTRYQMQTWGGTRKPETRLTDNLSPLLNQAHEGDYLVIQRLVSELDYFRLLLISQGTTDYETIHSIVGNNRWGVLGDVPPVSEVELEMSEQEEEDSEQQPFQLFDTGAAMTETKTIRVARSLAFRQTVLREYNNKCCVCGSALLSPSGLIELDAAHIVPRGRLGTDDARNGLALCKRHHWAFDNGLFGIDQNRQIHVPVGSQTPENVLLTALVGQTVSESNSVALQASPEALAWHMENIVNRQHKLTE